MIPKVPETFVDTVSSSSVDSPFSDMSPTHEYSSRCGREEVSVDQSTQPLPSLLSLIGSELFSSIRILNQQFKDSIRGGDTVKYTINLGNVGVVICLYLAKCEYHCLGWFDDRYERTKIHSALKREFPMLKSTTKTPKAS